MKKRKGFKTIIVDNNIYQYAILQRTNQIILYFDDDKYALDLPLPEETVSPSRHGKRKNSVHRVFGKKEVTQIIQQYFQEM